MYDSSQWITMVRDEGPVWVANIRLTALLSAICNATSHVRCMLEKSAAAGSELNHNSVSKDVRAIVHVPKATAYII
jgi:hypothetical protein